MEIKNYNQYDSYYTKNACSIVSLLNIFKYRYWIFVIPSFIVKLSIFFDKLWVFNIKSWAIFSVIDTAFVKYLNLKLGLNFKLVTNTIPRLSKTDMRTYQLGIKWYSTAKFNKAKINGEITKEWINYILSFNWTLWHATNWSWTAWWTWIDTNWSKNVKMSLETLKYGHSNWVFFTNIRTIDPADEETKQVCALTIKLFQAEKTNKLQLLYNKEHNNPYLDKAKKLYFYWR